MLDVVTRPSAPLEATSDTPATTRVVRGGAGANMAVVLSDAGHAVTYVGAVGDDAARVMIENDLRAAGVRPLLEVVAAPTGVVVAVVATTGQRAMMTDRGANRLLTLDHVGRALDEPLDHLHVSGYTLLDDATRLVGSSALAMALERSVACSVDVCSVAPLRAVTPAVFLAAARGATLLFANEEEALTLSGARDVTGALETLAQRFDEVVVTRGPLGIVARRGLATGAEPARGGAVLDTTGAGDAATGAYLGARLHGDDIAPALARAMDAAARVVRALGSRG